MNETLRNWWTRTNSIISNKFTPAQRRNIIIAVIAAIVFVVVLLWFISRPNYVTVLSGMDNTSLGDAQTKLADLKIPTQIQGDSILVPSSDADTARIQLSMAGIPKSGQLMYSGVQSGFGTTSDSFQIQVKDALQQSLDQTISKMDGVDSADVYIVMPQQQLFVGQTQDDAKASVFLKVAMGTQLSSAQVAGIQSLVAHSVNGLSMSNVSITDQNGADLTTPSSTSGTGAVSGSTELSTQQQIEQQLTSKLTAGLTQLLGPGNSFVMVHQNMSFNQVHTTTHELITPTPGSNTGYVVQGQTSKQTSGNGSSSAGGVSGQSSTNPGLASYSGSNGNGASSPDTSTQTNNTYTYGSKDVDQTSDPIQYNGVSVGIIVNSANHQINANYINQIKQFVAASMGVAPNSNQNNISVVSIPFQSQSMTASTASGLNSNLIWAGLGAAALLLGGYVILKRRKPSTGQQMDNPFEVLENPFDHIVPSDDERMKDQLSKLANQKPDEFANLLRTWISRD